MRIKWAVLCELKFVYEVPCTFGVISMYRGVMLVFGMKKIALIKWHAWIYRESTHTLMQYWIIFNKWFDSNENEPMWENDLTEIGWKFAEAPQRNANEKYYPVYKHYYLLRCRNGQAQYILYIWLHTSTIKILFTERIVRIKLASRKSRELNPSNDLQSFPWLLIGWFVFNCFFHGKTNLSFYIRNL